MNTSQLIELLDLMPLPDEGGLFHQTYQDSFSTAIYFLVRSDDFSALHRLNTTEIYHFYGGEPLQFLLLHPDGRIEKPILGPDIANGQRPQLAVAAGVWQGSATTGGFSLVGATMAPGFTEDGFELGRRAELEAVYPAAADDIARLTRDSSGADQ